VSHLHTEALFLYSVLPPSLILFFFNTPSPTHIYTLSLHDALPIYPFKYPEKPIKRGKVLGKEDLDRLGGFARYKDVDGDGIPYRTLPGTDHPGAAWFARGSGHNEKGQYSERPDDYERNMERINRKFETSRSYVPRPEVVAN